MYWAWCSFSMLTMFSNVGQHTFFLVCSERWPRCVCFLSHSLSLFLLEEKSYEASFLPEDEPIYFDASSLHAYKRFPAWVATEAGPKCFQLESELSWKCLSLAKRLSQAQSGFTYKNPRGLTAVLKSLKNLCEESLVKILVENSILIQTGFG